MIVYGVCKSCQNHLNQDAIASTRFELSKQIGDSLKKKCERCGVTNIFKVSQLKGQLPKHSAHAIVEVAIVGITIILAGYSILRNFNQISILLLLYIIPAIAYIVYTRKNFEVIETFNNSKA